MLNSCKTLSTQEAPQGASIYVSKCPTADSEYAGTELMLILEFGTKGRTKTAWNIGTRKFTLIENSVIIDWIINKGKNANNI